MEAIASLFPTDNLYKFLSITGLLVLGFCFIYPDIRLAELHQKITDLMGKANVLKYESDIQKRKSDENNKRMDEIIKKQAEAMAATEGDNEIEDGPNKDIEEAVNLLRRLRDKNEREFFEFRIKYDDYILPNQKDTKEAVAILDDLQKNRDLLGLKAVQINNLNELIKTDQQRIDFIMMVSYLGRIIGLFVSCFGFIQWYLLLQKPQDELMKFQIEEYRQRSMKDEKKVIAP